MRAPQYHVAAEVAYETGSALRAAIEDVRSREIVRVVSVDRRGWATCCGHSATGSCLQHQCCTRCGLVLT